jgi:hypothetical protein
MTTRHGLARPNVVGTAHRPANRAGLARRAIWLNQHKMLKTVWEVGINPRPDRRRVGDTRRSYLTSRTSCSGIYNIEYKMNTCIYDFL